MARKASGTDWLAGVIDRGCKAMPCLSRMAVRGGVGACTDLEVSAQSEVAMPDGVYRRIGREWVTDIAVPIEEMPVVTNMPITERRVELPAGAVGLLLQGVPFVAAAASTDDSRKVINNLLLEVKAGAARLVATDGKRMHVVELGEVKGEDCALLLSRKFCKLLLRMLSGYSAPIDLVSDGERVEVSANGMRLTLRMSDAQYPNWRAVYTDYERARVGYEYQVCEAARQVAVDWNPLANAAEPVAKEGRYLITFGRAPRLSIVTNDAGLKRKAVLGDGVHCGPGEILLRADYVADIARDWHGEGMTLRTGPDDFSPLEFVAPGVKAVLMPQRNRMSQAGQSFKRKAASPVVVGYGVSDNGDRFGSKGDESAEHGLCYPGGRPLSRAEAEDIKADIGKDAVIVAFFEAGEPQPISAEG